MNETEFQIGVALSPNHYPRFQSRVTEGFFAKTQINEMIQDKNFRSKYVVEDNHIVYEKYDRHGKLISKIPWIKKPFDVFA